MADHIKVSVPEMRTCVASYTKQKASLMSAFAICAKATAEIAASWAGPSFAATAAKMALTWKNLYQAEKKMDDAINELNKVMDIMEKTETSINKTVSSLEEGEPPF